MANPKPQRIVTSLPQIRLDYKTGADWVDQALDRFNEFLCDHAACERKASATGIQFVCRYPDRPSLIEPMIRLSREELLHFHQVVRIILKRGLSLQADEKDPYIRALLKNVRHHRDHHFLDRLLVFGIVEARGTERFGLIAENLEDAELRDFYQKLTEAEARHHEMFIEIACEFFDIDSVQARLAEFIRIESEILNELPLRPAVH